MRSHTGAYTKTHAHKHTYTLMTHSDGFWLMMMTNYRCLFGFFNRNFLKHCIGFFFLKKPNILQVKKRRMKWNCFLFFNMFQQEFTENKIMATSEAWLSLPQINLFSTSFIDLHWERFQKFLSNYWWPVQGVTASWPKSAGTGPSFSPDSNEENKLVGLMDG